MPSVQQPNHSAEGFPNGIVVPVPPSLNGKNKRSKSRRKNRHRPSKLEIPLLDYPTDTLSNMSVLTEMEKSSPEFQQDLENITSRKPSTLADISNSAENGIKYRNPSPRELKRSSTLFSSYDQTMFLNSSKVFAALQHEPRDDGSYEAAQRKKAFKKLDKTVPFLQFESDNERRLTYQLAYSALKYQFVIEDLLQDIAFFVRYPETANDLPLVTVVVSDYMQRKFLSRELHPGEIIYPVVKEVEDCIVESKIKLDAALARRRIREYARTVDALLPSTLIAKEGLADQLLTYAWINYNKSSTNYVMSELRTSGYQLLTDAREPITGSYFRVDPLFEDTLIFAPEQALDLGGHRLVQQGCLVIQDRTSLFGPQSTLPLLNTSSDDILVIDHSCGATSAHLSSLMKVAKRSGDIHLFGIRSKEHKSEVQMNLDILDASNVKVVDEALDNIEHDDVRLRNVKVVMVHGQCSKSAVQDPVGFVITEGEDISILQDLSLGKPSTRRVNEMSSRNLSDIQSAIRFPKVQAAVYVTRSNLALENEKIVLKAIESYNIEEGRKHLFRVTPPVMTLDRKVIDHSAQDKYYRESPTQYTNGCFVAMVTKEIEHIKESHQTILQRAAATGLLDETAENEQDAAAGDKSKTKPKRTKSKSKKSAGTASGKHRVRKPSFKRVIAFGTSSGSVLTPRPRDTL